MSTPYVIETQGLSKSYQNVQALQSLDLKVQSNSICGFLGPNGAGKTTTIKLLLAVPLALVFSRYLAEGRGAWTLLPLALVLLFMLAKALLDFVLRIDFRRNRVTLLAYLTLKCLALFSLVWFAFGIHPS